MAMTKSNTELAESFVKLDIHADRLLWDEETKSYWLYDGRIWTPYDMEDMRSIVSEMTRKIDPANRLTIGKMEDIVRQVKDCLGPRRLRYDSMASDKIYGHRVKCLEEKGISFEDGILLLDDSDNGWTPRIVPHSFDLDRMAFVHLPFRYSELKTAQSPLFDKYLKDTCTDKDGNFNALMRDQLQELAGFVLSNERAETCVILQGEGRNGKSPFLDLLRGLVGEERCSALSLGMLSTDKFCLPGLIGMKLNAKAEDESKGVNLALLKELISGEPMSARRLYEPVFRFRPRCKFVFATNNPPQMTGLDQATKARIFIIPFEHRMERKDFIRDLGKRMVKQELAAFVRWSIEGMKRMKANNCIFTDSTQSVAALIDLEDANSSVAEYMRDNWVKDASSEVLFADVYQHYLDTTKHRDSRGAVSKNKFGRQIKPFAGESYAKQNKRYLHVRKIEYRGQEKLPEQLPLGEYENDCVRKEDKTPEF